MRQAEIPFTPDFDVWQEGYSITLSKRVLPLYEPRSTTYTQWSAGSLAKSVVTTTIKQGENIIHLESPDKVYEAFSKSMQIHNYLARIYPLSAIRCAFHLMQGGQLQGMLSPWAAVIIQGIQTEHADKLAELPAYYEQATRLEEMQRHFIQTWGPPTLQNI